MKHKIEILRNDKYFYQFYIQRGKSLLHFYQLALIYNRFVVCGLPSISFPFWNPIFCTVHEELRVCVDFQICYTRPCCLPRGFSRGLNFCVVVSRSTFEWSRYIPIIGNVANKRCCVSWKYNIAKDVMIITWDVCRRTKLLYLRVNYLYRLNYKHHPCKHSHNHLYRQYSLTTMFPRKNYENIEFN